MRPTADEVNEILSDFIEIEPLNKDQFLKVRETLTRIGLPGRQNGKQVLWQTAHVFQKRGHYYICHFKQLFELDGEIDSIITEDDYDRVDYIASLLNEWGLVKVLAEFEKPKASVVIIPYSKKHEWLLKSKYTLGSEKLRYRREHGKEVRQQAG